MEGPPPVLRGHRLVRHLFPRDRSYEVEQAGRAVDDELEGVPDAPQHDQVEPRGRLTVDQDCARVGDGEARDGDEHRRNVPPQASPGSHGCEQPVARHVMLEEVTGGEGDEGEGIFVGLLQVSRDGG